MVLLLVDLLLEDLVDIINMCVISLQLFLVFQDDFLFFQPTDALSFIHIGLLNLLLLQPGQILLQLHYFTRQVFHQGVAVATFHIPAQPVGIVAGIATSEHYSTVSLGTAVGRSHVALRALALRKVALAGYGVPFAVTETNGNLKLVDAEATITLNINYFFEDLTALS